VLSRRRRQPEQSNSPHPASARSQIGEELEGRESLGWLEGALLAGFTFGKLLKLSIEVFEKEPDID
jgi:hypothetical protein